MTQSVHWDVDKFETELAKQVRNRKLMVRSSSCNVRTGSSHLFDQFLLIGVPPKSSDMTPSILVAYPPISMSCIDMTTVIAMAMPTGPKRQDLRSNEGRTLQDEFVFTVAYGDDTIYGVCLHVYAKSFRNTFFVSKHTKSTFFALCFLTRKPVIAAHLSFLAYLALISIDRIDRAQLEDSPTAVLEGKPVMKDMLIDEGVGHVDGVDVPKFFAQAVKFYHSRTLNSAPMFLTRKIEIYFPQVADDSSIMSCVLDTIFSILSVDHVVSLVGALMLDAQVVVIGSNLHEITSTVLALQLLVKPFRFCGPVIPILPHTETFLRLLGSPTPFLIGVPACRELKDVVFLDTSIFVYLDRKTVAIPEGPLYPAKQQVVKKLEELISKEKSHTPHPFGFPGIFRQHYNYHYCFTPMTCTLITAALHEPLNQLFSDFLYGFFVTDRSTRDGEGVTVFNSELFMAQVEESKRPFFKALIESQNFENFVEDKITEYVELKAKK